MESIRQAVGKLNDIDVKICMRTYSEKILGYRVFLDNETIIFLNRHYDRDVTSDTFDRLMLLSEKFVDYGFIMLLSNYELYYCNHFKYSDSKGAHVFSPNINDNDSKGNLIMLDKSLIEIKKNKKIIENLKGMNNIE